MKCPIDENLFCSRHKTHHKGRLYELSQMENEIGEKYRQLWDRQLNITQATITKNSGGCNCGKR